MGGKAKGKGKKGKGKKGAKEEVKQEETEYDNMDLEMLQEVVPMLKQQLEKSMLDRNYVQLERDTIQTFYSITQREVSGLEMAISAKDREMELMEDNHRVEVRVYIQKVKHLEYEHKNNLQQVQLEADHLLAQEMGMHQGRDQDLNRTKKELRTELAERAVLNADEIAQVKEAQHKNLTKMREGFEANLQELRERCEARLAQLEDDLELRRKVHVHEIEERKNLHINDLMRNHEKAFGQMKAYYNDITNDNLNLIRSLKEELQEMKKKAVANQKLMLDISQENKRLSEPLAVAVADVAHLRGELKDQEKDRLSLANARARLRVEEEQLVELREGHAELEEQHEALEKQRDTLYDEFESVVRAVQQRSDFKNLVLDQKLTAMESAIQTSGAQLQEIVKAAQLDPNEVDRLMGSLDEMLTARNGNIKDLQFQLMRVTKAYNDSLRTYGDKLGTIGIPAEELDKMGFVAVATTTSSGPAGLIVQ